MGIFATAFRKLRDLSARDPSPLPNRRPGSGAASEWAASLAWLPAFLLAAAAFLLLAGEPVVGALGLDELRGRYRAPLGATVVLGLPVALWLILVRLSRLSAAARTDAVLALVGAAFLAFLFAAALERSIDYLSAGLLAVVGSLTLLFGGRFFTAVSTGDPPRIETNWGGLGGTMGGWTASPSLVYLAAALLFGGFATVLGVRAAAPEAQPSSASIVTSGEAAELPEAATLDVP